MIGKKFTILAEDWEMLKEDGWRVKWLDDEVTAEDV
jgi:hypothetical protein